MRLSCPGCQTEYEVPDTALTGRVRTLRCAHCSHQWEYGPLSAAKLTDSASETAIIWPPANPAPAVAALKAAHEPIREAAFETGDAPVRDTWPISPEPTAIQPPYQPAVPLQPIGDLPGITTAAERTQIERALAAADPAEPDLADKAYLPEIKSKPAAGNEERFAALVRTAREEPEAEIEPGRKKSSGLLISILLLIGICAGIWFARFHIMQAWPPSTRLFNGINNIISAFTTAPHH